VILRRLYVLFFLEHSARRVRLARLPPIHGGVGDPAGPQPADEPRGSS
jgi:hypothetical protein